MAFTHQALRYHGTDGLLAGILPYIREGLKQGEVVRVATRPETLFTCNQFDVKVVVWQLRRASEPGLMQTSTSALIQIRRRSSVSRGTRSGGGCSSSSDEVIASSTRW